MSESGIHRPRRAFARGTDSEKPIVDDDTPASQGSAARRGVDAQAGDPPAHDSGSGEAQASQPSNPSGDDSGSEEGPASQPSNPFARPGSEAAAVNAPESKPLVPAPAPVMPIRDSGDGETTGSGRGMSGVAEVPAPEPRRSAASSATPPEVLADEATPSSGEASTWVQHHRKTLLFFVIGALVVALLLVFGAFWAGRGDPSPSPTTSPSPSTSVSLVPAVSDEDLITLEDANAIVDGATWDITRTAETREEAEGRPACIGAGPDDVNPTDTFQRLMGTSQEDALAALHQVDLYANESTAQRVQRERVQSLIKCDEVQAHILYASTVTGLADEVTQLTVSYQEEQEAMHTVLLVRTGRALTMLDVTRNAAGVPVEGAVAGLERSLSEICGRVDGTCPSVTAVTAAVPPPVDPEGWLIIADLSRIRPGYGRWVPTDPAEITSPGMGCENLPLATEPGPTERQQRTYLLSQDDETPKSFGMDEMVFDFEDNEAAQAFTTKLIDSLKSCKDRRETAVVTDLGTVEGTGAEDVAVSASLIGIDLATSDDDAVKYQLVVAIADTRVSYLLTSVTDDYLFTEDQQKELALRVAQRNSQG